MTDIYNVLPAELRAGVILAYVKSLRTVFLVGAISGKDFIYTVNCMTGLTS